MKKFLTVVCLCLLLTTHVKAQDKGKFSPEKFQAELEQFITKEACLTPQEAASFFPVYREMQKKQRAIFERQRQLGKVKPLDERECEKAIRQRDENELEQKRILQVYHDKMLSVVSASKLFDVIQAEDRFHRMKFRSWSSGRPKRATHPVSNRR